MNGDRLYAARNLVREVAHSLGQHSPPCYFLGVTGSVARGAARPFSDLDLLLVISRDAQSFWHQVCEVGRFVDRLAHMIHEKIGVPVVVSSSLVAEDLMPFAAGTPDRLDHLNLHLLTYPSPQHLVRWEPAEVRNGLVKSLAVNKENTLLGDFADLEIEIRHATLAAETDEGKVQLQASDICIQAFLTGLIQAHCHRLYPSAFVCRYAFHLFRYAGRYLLPLETRREFLDLGPSTTPAGPPISASDPMTAYCLIRDWLDAWTGNSAEPPRSELQSLYDSAALYYANLFDHLEARSHSAPRTLIVARSAWSAQEVAGIMEIAQTEDGPLFVVSTQRVRTNLAAAREKLVSTLGSQVEVWFSLKSFPSSGLIKVLDFEATRARVCVASEREIDLAYQCGVQASNMMLHAPVFTPSIIKMLRSGFVGTVSVGSHSQLASVRACLCQQTGLLVRLRLPSECRSKFGFAIDELLSVIRKDVNKTISGVHVHLGEHLYRPEILSRVGVNLVAIMKVLLERTERPVLNLGGGWRSRLCEDWHGGDGLLGFKALWEMLAAACPQDLPRVVVQCELGRRVISDAVVAVGHVLDSKRLDDGWAHFLDLGTGMLPLLRSNSYGVSVMLGNQKMRKQRGILVGPGCYERDRFADVQVAATPGDLVIFSNAGAYTVAMASGFGGSFPRIFAFDLLQGTKAEAKPCKTEWRLWTVDDAMSRDERTERGGP